MKDRLKRIDDSALCISRKRWGQGYRYFDADDQPIQDSKVLRRIRSLVIPPMWDEVQICKWNDGHIQAIGRDQKGRKQYIYHSRWEKMRQEEKFNRMVDFGSALPALRKIAFDHIQKAGWQKQKVISLLILLLDETGVRIGNSQYARRNGTYGLTTLRRKHVDIMDDQLIFNYRGKKNKEREVAIDDEELIKYIKKCCELPGYELFRFRIGPKKWENIDSEDVNTFIQQYMGPDFSSKDFRTWTATRLAVEFYQEARRLKKKNRRRNLANILLRLVADELGNTPTICKDYYVHPAIMRAIEQRSLPTIILEDQPLSETDHSPAEQIVLELIA